MNHSEEHKSRLPISTTLKSILESEAERAPGIDKTRMLGISIVAVIIGWAASFIAKLLVFLIDLFTNLAFYGTFSFAHTTPAQHTYGIYVVIVPVVGGLIVGCMAYFGSKAIRGHGIPEAMEQILTNRSKIKPSITYLKPLSAAISIGTGGPFGAEGPIIATGGALGSTIGQLLKITDHERKILLAAGATAGMSAIFGSPIAAVFLAIELLLFEFSPRSILPVALACITGAAGHHLFFQPGPVFPIAGTIPMPGNISLVVYSIMGIVIGFCSVAITKSVYWIEDSFERIPIHWMWWPAIGGIVVGIVGYFEPRTLGVGYENIVDLLSGTLPLRMMLVLFLLKLLSWSFALGSGTSGGTLAPLLTIGSAAGALLAVAIQTYVPGSDISISLAALVGMASMFAGASRALLTSIVFALETTSQPNALLPLLAGCTGAFFVSFFLMENTIMTEKIARRGVKTPHSFKPDALERITIQQIIFQSNVLLRSDSTIMAARDAAKHADKNRETHFMVINQTGEFQGIIRLHDLIDHANANELVGEITQPIEMTISIEESVLAAAELMARKDIYVLGVEGPTRNIVHILSAQDIIYSFRKGLEEHDQKNRSISLRRNLLKVLSSARKLLARDPSKR